MDVYRTEEEQVAALKKWWKDNGNSLLAGILIALAVIFGWKAYQKNQENENTLFSSSYQLILNLSAKQDLSDEDKVNLELAAKKLKQDAQDTEYALFASLFLAKLAVDQNKLDVAEKELKWNLAHQQDQAIQATVRTRLARVIAAQDRVDEALALLEEAIKADKDKAFTALYESVKGDLLISKGDKTGAIKAYKTAYEDAKAKSVDSPLIKMKLSSLGVLVGDA